MQVQEGQALTRVQLAVAKGEMDMGTIPLVTVFLMKHGLAMYKNLGAEKGAELAQNLKAITGFNTGVYHAMTFADSEIKEWKDFKGKRVFIGAPTGGAAQQVQQLIKIVTGYLPGKDYEAIKLDWGAGVQGLLDGKIDVVFRPGTIPAAYMNRLTSAGKVRILGIPQSVATTEAFKEFSNAPGTLPAVIPLDCYDTDKVEVTNQGATLAIGLGLVVNTELDDELVYQITKAYIGELPNMLKASPWVPHMRLEEATFGLKPMVGLKMHPGAIKAWQEAGKTIPDYLK